MLYSGFFSSVWNHESPRKKAHVFPTSVGASKGRCRGCVDRTRTMKAEKIFKLAKGFRGRAKNTIRIARNRVEKALQYSYRDRKAKKRDFRGLWIQQINAGVREHGIGYGEFISGLKDENIQLNRKMLAEIAQTEPYSFKALVDTVKRMRGYPVDPPKA